MPSYKIRITISIPPPVAVPLSMAGTVAGDLRGGLCEGQRHAQVSLGGFVVIEPGSASLRAVALATDVIVVSAVSAVAIRITAAAWRVTVAGSAVS